MLSETNKIYIFTNLTSFVAYASCTYMILMPDCVFCMLLLWLLGGAFSAGGRSPQELLNFNMAQPSRHFAAATPNPSGSHTRMSRSVSFNTGNLSPITEMSRENSSASNAVMGQFEDIDLEELRENESQEQSNLSDVNQLNSTRLLTGSEQVNTGRRLIDSIRRGIESLSSQNLNLARDSTRLSNDLPVHARGNLTREHQVLHFPNVDQLNSVQQRQDDQSRMGPSSQSYPNEHLPQAIRNMTYLRPEEEVGRHESVRRMGTTVDDRAIIGDLLSRVPPCLSDQVSEVFDFLVKIMPLADLYLVPDFILMKYLVPKVRGELARILLRVASVEGSFEHVYAAVRHELFCNRSMAQLVETRFLKKFQEPNQETGAYFELMQNTYNLLRKPFNEEEAVEIILENARPDVVIGLRGRAWPSSFKELKKLIPGLNRYARVSEERYHNLTTANSRQDAPLGEQYNQEWAMTNPDLTVQNFSVNPNQYRGGMGNKFQSPIKTIMCFYCKNVGHMKNQCPQLLNKSSKQGRGFSTNRRDSVKCFQCQQLGHYKSECTNMSNRTENE